VGEGRGPSGLVATPVARVVRGAAARARSAAWGARKRPACTGAQAAHAGASRAAAVSARADVTRVVTAASIACVGRDVGAGRRRAVLVRRACALGATPPTAAVTVRPRASALSKRTERTPSRSRTLWFFIFHRLCLLGTGRLLSILVSGVAFGAHLASAHGVCRVGRRRRAHPAEVASAAGGEGGCDAPVPARGG